MNNIDIQWVIDSLNVNLGAVGLDLSVQEVKKLDTLSDSPASLSRLDAATGLGCKG